MFSTICRNLQLLAALALFTLGARTAPAVLRATDLIPKFPRVGNHKTINRSVWDKWFSVRHRYPMAKANEMIVQSSKTGTTGSVMPLGFAMIFRISSAPRAGTTAIVQGRILQAYNEAGGVHGKLGFPTADADAELYQHGFGQVFEGGRIVYSATYHKFEVFYNE